MKLRPVPLIYLLYLTPYDRVWSQPPCRSVLCRTENSLRALCADEQSNTPRIAHTGGQSGNVKLAPERASTRADGTMASLPVAGEAPTCGWTCSPRSNRKQKTKPCPNKIASSLPFLPTCKRGCFPRLSLSRWRSARCFTSQAYSHATFIFQSTRSSRCCMSWRQAPRRKFPSSAMRACSASPYSWAAAARPAAPWCRAPDQPIGWLENHYKMNSTAMGNWLYSCCATPRRSLLRWHRPRCAIAIIR